MSSTQPPPLSEIQWSAPALAQTMGGIHTNTVHPYFAASPFYDPTSNNATLTTQALNNPTMFHLIQTRAAFETRLRSMPGLEFLITHDPSENDTKTAHSGVWVLRKQVRRRAQGGGMPDEVVPLSSYYVVGENVYMAPSVGDVVEGRLLAAMKALGGFFEGVKGLPNFTPARGYSYLPPATHKTAMPGVSLQGTQASQEGTPVITDGTPLLQGTQDGVGGKKEMVAAKASTADLSALQLLADSYMLSMKYGEEYMDETPIVGEPGSFKLSKARETMLAAPSAGAMAKVESQRSTKSVAPAKTETPTPQLKTEDLPAPIKKPSKGAEKSPITPGGKEKKARRKSKGPGVGDTVTPKVTTPKPVTPT